MPLTPFLFFVFFYVRDTFLRIGKQAVNYLLLFPQMDFFFRASWVADAMLSYCIVDD